MERTKVVALVPAYRHLSFKGSHIIRRLCDKPLLVFESGAVVRYQVSSNVDSESIAESVLRQISPGIHLSLTSSSLLSRHVCIKTYLMTEVKHWRVSLLMPWLPSWKAVGFIHGIKEGVALQRMIRRLNRTAREKWARHGRIVKDSIAVIRVNPDTPMEWSIFLQLPNKTQCRVSLNAYLSARKAYSRIMFKAEVELHENASALYALLNGKHFAIAEAPIHALGFYDGCTVEIFYRLRGGVCVSNRDGGRKRGVSVV